MTTNEITELIACHTCGSSSWESTEDYSETLRLRIHTVIDAPIMATEKSIWYDCQDASDWLCENDHAPTEEQANRLNELRAELDFIQ